MRAREFVRNLKYDARPRTISPIELFNSVVALTFDTMLATESQDANCMECVVITLMGLQLAMRHPCRIDAAD